jgi:hypothetical protein
MVHAVADLVFGDPEDPKQFVMTSTIFTSGDARLSILDYTAWNHQESSKSSVYCVARGYFFQLDKASRDKRYAVVDLRKVGGSGGIDPDSFVLRLDLIPRFAYAVWETPVPALIKRPSFEVLSASDVSEAGYRPRIEIKFRVADPSHWMSGGSMVFAPDLDWALTGYDLDLLPVRRAGTVAVPAGTRFRARLRPRRWPSGHVFSEQGETRVVFPPEFKSRATPTAFRVRSVEFVDVPDSQFRPSAFGLPDAVVEPGRSRSIGLNYGFIVAGVVLLALSIVLKRVSTRRAT